MWIADSSGLVGAKPDAMTCAAFEADCQLSFVAIVTLSEERTSWICGSEMAPSTPKLMSEGPMARITTVFGVAPLITNPPIIRLKPVCTWPRVEMLARRGGFEGGKAAGGRNTESTQARSRQFALPCGGAGFAIEQAKYSTGR